MILVSPEFLYRVEESRNQDMPYLVTGLELATRLSYFLWSRPPDAELLKLGRDGTLHKDEVLKSQIARMLNSPKRVALSENFAGQWLGFNDLLSNSEYLRDERWNRESYDEILYFFDEMIRSGRSVLELVQSDWLYRRASALQSKGQDYTKVNPSSMKRLYADIFANRQTKSTDQRLRYGPPVLVERKGDREGGIITSAAVMRLTASKTRTSPIRRGVWVLNTLIASVESSGCTHTWPTPPEPNGRPPRGGRGPNGGCEPPWSPEIPWLSEPPSSAGGSDIRRSSRSPAFPT